MEKDQLHVYVLYELSSPVASYFPLLECLPRFFFPWISPLPNLALYAPACSALCIACLENIGSGCYAAAFMCCHAVAVVCFQAGCSGGLLVIYLSVCI